MKKRKKNIGINAILSMTKQCMALFFPLITYPYVLRVLGTESVGKVNYVTSNVSYFTMFAMLGTSTYAVREGAKYKNDRKKFTQFANEIFTINIIFTVISYFLLFITVLSLKKLHGYAGLFAIQSANIVIAVLNVDWINTIYEDFWIQTLRTVICYILSAVMLFTFIHQPSDYYIYAALLVAAAIPPCILNIIHCRKYAHFHVVRKPNMSAHIKPLLVLFCNQLAISIYTNADMSMLGWIKGDYSVGLYSVAVKIYNILKNMMAAIYTVSIPRLAAYHGENRDVDYKKLYTDLWGYLSLLLIPAVFGVVCVSKEIILLMGGENYYESAVSLQILAVALLFAIFGGLVTVCLNVIIGHEVENLKATIMSAGINFGLNLIFIPIFSHNGAAITTLVSELFVFAFCFIRVQNKSKYMDLKVIGKTIFHCIFAALIMLIYSVYMHGIIRTLPMQIAIIIPGCVVVYFVMLAILKDAYFFKGLNTLVGKVKIRKRK